MCVCVCVYVCVFVCVYRIYMCVCVTPPLPPTTAVPFQHELAAVYM